MTDITWTNDTRRLSDLVPWEHNPKRMTKKQAEGLRLSIERFGFAVPFLVSPDGDIYDGHQRQTLMNAIKEYGPNATVDVRVSSRPLDDDERRELVVRLKQNQAGWDFDMLPNLYEREELLEWGFEPEELGMFADEPQGEDPGPRTDKAAELQAKWQVESGQLWALGEHRLICGDCTDRAVVDRLMGGEKLSAMITDPPYGIDYKESKNWAKPDNVKRPVIGDNKPYDALDIWNSDIPVWCLWGANYYSNTIPVYADGNYVVWAKAHSDDENKVFGSAFELCWMYPKHKQEVWFVRRINMSGEEHGLHVTQKPIEVIERCIEYHRLGDDVIIGDLYLGSGTTLIACERLGRRCRACEIEPSYVGVALERWATMTGQTPVLVDGAS